MAGVRNTMVATIRSETTGKTEVMHINVDGAPTVIGRYSLANNVDINVETMPPNKEGES